MQPQSPTFNSREDLSLLIDEFDEQMNRRGYVAHLLFPLIPRDKKSGKMPRRKLEEELQEVETRRNPDGSFNRVRHEFDDDTYDTQSHGLECALDDETLERYDDLIDAETYEGNVMEGSILRNYEKENVEFATTEGNYDASRVKTPGTSWSDRTNSVPIDNIDAYREEFFLDLGQEPNALAVNRKQFRDLINSAQIIDRSKGQNFQDVRSGSMARNITALAMALDLDMIIVANSVKGGVPGGSRSMSRIWPNNRAVLCRVAVTDDPNEVCWGRTFIWSPFGAIGEGGRMGVIAESYDEPQTASSVQRRRANWGRKRLHEQAAYLIKL